MKEEPNAIVADGVLKKINTWALIFGDQSNAEIDELIQMYKLEAYFSERSRLKRSLETPQTPSDMKHILDQFVVGQDQAKRSACFAFYLHLLRTNMIQPNIYKRERNIKRMGLQNLPRPNMLLIGKTGSGKTYIIKTLCELFELPFIKVDCSSLVSSGYMGNTLLINMGNLYSKSGENIDKMKNAVVFFDEFDKVSGKNKPGLDVKGVSIQEELLTFIENDRNRLQFRQEILEFDSSQMLFIFSGSFASLEEELLEKHNQKQSAPGFKQKFHGDKLRFLKIWMLKILLILA